MYRLLLNPKYKKPVLRKTTWIPVTVDISLLLDSELDQSSSSVQVPNWTLVEIKDLVRTSILFLQEMGSEYLKVEQSL
jgi:hypothetical protein